MRTSNHQAAFALTLVCFVSGCGLSSESGSTQPMPENVEALLTTVENPTLDGRTRAAAAQSLGKIGERAAAVRLAAQLGDASGALFFEIVIALGRIGNVDVLPTLEAIERSPHDLSGKNNSVLISVIADFRKLKKDRDDDRGPVGNPRFGEQFFE